MKVFCVITFLSLNLFIHSQTYFTKHFSVNDGLPSNHIYKALQDSKGYIWFATDNGISRFDGKRFKNFTSRDGLPDNDVFDLREDSWGRMWLSCFSNHRCYIYENKVYTHENDSSLKKLTGDTYCKFISFQNKIIINLQPPYATYEINESGKLSRLPLKTYGLEAFRDHLIITSPHGSYFYLLNNRYTVVDSLYFSPELKRVSNDPVTSVCPTGENRFIVLMKNGSHPEYKIVGDRIVPCEMIRNQDTFVRLQVFGDHLWMNKDVKGIIPVTDKLLPDMTRPVLFPGKLISSFMVDREGNYWGCSFSEGVYLIPNNAFLYQFTRDQLTQKTPVKITSFKKEIYVGFNNSDVEELRYKRLYRNLISPHSLTNQKKLYCLHADSLSILLSRPDGIVTIDKKTGVQKRFRVDNVKWVHKERDYILFGTHMGAFMLSASGRLPVPVFYGRTTTAYLRNNGDLLVGTVNGLQVCRKDSSGRWNQEKMFPEVLGETRISCISEAGDVLVIGTVQRGLLMVKGSDYEFVELNNNITDFNCNDFFIDAHENIWVAAFEGLFRISFNGDIHNYQTSRISAFNGLLCDIVNDVVVVDDTVYAAGSEGISIFPANERSVALKTPPSVFIDEVLVNGVSFGNTDKILLPPNSDNIEFRLSGIDFKSLGNILFRYRVIGLNNNWQLSANNFVRFESLPHGEYRFEVMAMNAQNIWSAEPAVFRIIVAPYWWQELWFHSLVLALLILFVYLIMRILLLRKHSRELRQAAMKRHIVETDLRAIKAQINPHFVFNTLHAVQYFISNHQNDEAEHYISSMAQLIRRTLDFSNKTSVTIGEEIMYLENYLQLERLRFDDNFKFEIRNRLPENSKAIEIPPMVLQPHVENALRHGLKNKRKGLKKLDIRFQLLDNNLVCEIEDNGIGRKQAAENKRTSHSTISLGTELSQAKLNIYEYLKGKKVNTEITDLYHADTNIPAGTIVRITINQ